MSLDVLSDIAAMSLPILATLNNGPSDNRPSDKDSLNKPTFENPFEAMPVPRVQPQQATAPLQPACKELIYLCRLVSCKDILHSGNTSYYPLLEGSYQVDELQDAINACTGEEQYLVKLPVGGGRTPTVHNTSDVIHPPNFGLCGCCRGALHVKSVTCIQCKISTCG